ncbi:uncharacterized protein YbbC (DUF1343 family) [Mesoflavibacter sabulilitoris]|nr:DUF1343 domain-containing protein [Mesoflavibacter zeaxanthinifaciens]MBB3124996.1 uncharacterized protein YbbC (DUF1343 family) [Mesoflavibacter zeaxanthinifaciens subsp. sabulilitoris]
MIFSFNWCKNTVLLFVLTLFACGNQTKKSLTHTEKTVIKTEADTTTETSKPLVLGVNRTKLYLPLLKGKRVGIVANQTSEITFLQRAVVDESTMGSKKVTQHLVDYLKDYMSVNVTTVFAPEHGFRGQADAGEVVKDGIDTKTGLPIISLYGNNKKPTANQLKDIDVIVFDIQDVGARFYTYISTLHYVMEACAENNIKVIVLDRPNPNGHYVDGPILDPEYKSFVGMHPVAIVHGLTIGEYAKMVNGEGWLKNNITCDLTVIPMDNYARDLEYDLPVKPSPNLPNAKAINLYPSLCFFEGTNVSAGRGTDMQFQIYGSPDLPKTDFTFTPKSNDGAKYPKHENKVCNGYDLRDLKRLDKIDLSFIINAYNATKNKESFFLKNNFIAKLAGTNKLQKQIKAGWTEDKIKATWQSGLEDYLIKRKPYLIYN